MESPGIFLGRSTKEEKWKKKNKTKQLSNFFSPFKVYILSNSMACLFLFFLHKFLSSLRIVATVLFGGSGNLLRWPQRVSVNNRKFSATCFLYFPFFLKHCLFKCALLFALFFPLENIVNVSYFLFCIWSGWMRKGERTIWLRLSYSHLLELDHIIKLIFKINF